MLTYKVDENDLKQRADIFIQQRTPQLNRRLIKQLASAGKLSFASRKVAAGYKLKIPGILELDYELQTLDQIPQLQLKIVFEDEDLIVLNKPSGVLVHARSRYWNEASIASSLRKHCRWPVISQPASPEDLRAGIIHRLDRGTSGTLVCAKNEMALAGLQQQFRSRQVKKTYLGIIAANRQLPDRGLIDKPIARSFVDRRKFKASHQGREAQTFFNIKSKQDKYYLLEIKPQTGRTHQIRVHLSSLNLPLLGDQLYKGPPAPRLMLHAQKIGFKHPKTNTMMSFTVRRPRIFTEILTGRNAK